MKKRRENIFQHIQNKINKSCEQYKKRLNSETDEIKRLRLQYEITKKSLLILLTEIKKLSNIEWEKYAEEFFEPALKQSELISEKLDNIALKKSKDVKEFEKYKKMKKISIKANEEVLDIIDTIDLNKKQLERLLALIFKIMIDTENYLRQNQIDFYEFNESGNIVRRRFGFDYNWLVCLSLIQLHENLIKKKLIELGGEIEEDESIRSLINKLSKLIKEKENREVSFALLLSNGIKMARDTMSHEGYKHPVSKQDLESIFEEIVKLEHTLYPVSSIDKRN